jgi:hypothetical protein
MVYDVGVDQFYGTLTALANNDRNNCSMQSLVSVNLEYAEKMRSIVNEKRMICPYGETAPGSSEVYYPNVSDLVFRAVYKLPSQLDVAGYWMKFGNLNYFGQNMASLWLDTDADGCEYFPTGADIAAGLALDDVGSRSYGLLCVSKATGLEDWSLITSGLYDWFVEIVVMVMLSPEEHPLAIDHKFNISLGVFEVNEFENCPSREFISVEEMVLIWSSYSHRLEDGYMGHSVYSCRLILPFRRGIRFMPILRQMDEVVQVKTGLVYFQTQEIKLGGIWSGSGKADFSNVSYTILENDVFVRKYLTSPDTTYFDFMGTGTLIPCESDDPNFSVFNMWLEEIGDIEEWWADILSQIVAHAALTSPSYPVNEKYRQIMGNEAFTLLDLIPLAKLVTEDSPFVGLSPSIITWVLSAVHSDIINYVYHSSHDYSINELTLAYYGTDFTSVELSSYSGLYKKIGSKAYPTMLGRGITTKLEKKSKGLSHITTFMKVQEQLRKIKKLKAVKSGTPTVYLNHIIKRFA